MQIGSKVRLNDTGIKCIFGTSVGLSHMRKLEMYITHMGTTSMTDDVDTYDVQVDNPDINQFVLCDRFFEEIHEEIL